MTEAADHPETAQSAAESHAEGAGAPTAAHSDPPAATDHPDIITLGGAGRSAAEDAAALEAAHGGGQPTHAQTELPDYHPELGEPAVYRDANGTLHAALVTRVMGEHTVHLVVFPDQGHHFHADAKAIDEPHPEDDEVKGAPGWFPVDMMTPTGESSWTTKWPALLLALIAVALFIARHYLHGKAITW